MSEQDATRIIAALQKRHAKFHLISHQCHDRGMFMTFEQIDIDPRTVSNWFESVGCYALYVGSEGTGDRRVMCAEVRL